MIDVLPTILDLLDLPMPEIMMGQSLAPLLLGTEGWEPRPVILDEFDVDRETHELRGVIEVVDGRWGASLEIRPDPEEERDLLLIDLNRPTPLLLFDLWNDPFCLHSLHEERPDLVKRYTEFLEAQWEAHQALGQHFTRPEDSPLTPEQKDAAIYSALLVSSDLGDLFRREIDGTELGRQPRESPRSDRRTL